MTPFAVTHAGVIQMRRAQFIGGLFNNLTGVPASLRLIVLRTVAGTTEVAVVAEREVHDP